MTVEFTSPSYLGSSPKCSVSLHLGGERVTQPAFFLNVEPSTPYQDTVSLATNMNKYLNKTQIEDK